MLFVISRNTTKSAIFDFFISPKAIKIVTTVKPLAENVKQEPLNCIIAKLRKINIERQQDSKYCIGNIYHQNSRMIKKIIYTMLKLSFRIFILFPYNHSFIIQNQYILADVRKSTCVNIRFPNVSVEEASLSLSYVLLFLTVYLNQVSYFNQSTCYFLTDLSEKY